LGRVGGVKSPFQLRLRRAPKSEKLKTEKPKSETGNYARLSSARFLPLPCLDMMHECLSIVAGAHKPANLISRGAWHVRHVTSGVWSGPLGGREMQGESQLPGGIWREGRRREATPLNADL